MAVDGEPELQLGGDLVAFGDGHLPHVVAKPGELRALQIVPRARDPHPGRQSILHLSILPVANDHFATEPHARVDEPGLAITVRGLVEVHEVHVDRSPRQIAVELSMEVNKRFAQGVEPADPHLRRGKRVHPEDEARAVLRVVCFKTKRADLLRRFHDRLENNVERNPGRGVETSDDGPGVGGHLRERFRTVEMLAAGDEPDFGVSEKVHED